ncbi:TPA: hypothetical protein ACH3X2_012192 [Trebouxia sp. C0005]
MPGMHAASRRAGQASLRHPPALLGWAFEVPSNDDFEQEHWLDGKYVQKLGGDHAELHQQDKQQHSMGDTLQFAALVYCCYRAVSRHTSVQIIPR